MGNARMHVKLSLIVLAVALIFCVSPITFASDNHETFINKAGSVIARDVSNTTDGTEEWWAELPDFKHESFVERTLNFIVNIGYMIWPSKPWAGWLIFFVLAYAAMRVINPALDFLEDMTGRR